MKHRLLSGADGERTYMLVFEVDDDVLPELQRFAETERIRTASLIGVGGFRRATVGFYNLADKRYEPIEVDEQVEVLSLAGNVALYEGKPKVHVHAVLGKRNGSALGGHFLSGVVRPTLELVVRELGEPVNRSDRPDIGIPLIDLER